MITSGKALGREEELHRIKQHLEQSSSKGEGSMVWVSGAPGVGKSTLMAELEAYCYEQGHKVRSALCYEAGVAAFQPVEALLGHPIERDGIEDEFYLSTKFDQALNLASSEHPLVLFIDDGQWADYGTAMFLSHCLARKLEYLSIVIFSRPLDQSGASTEIESLYRRMIQRGSKPIALENLGYEDTKELADNVFGEALREETAQMVYRETGGHPLSIVHYCCEMRELGVDWNGVRLPGKGGKVLPKEIDDLLQARIGQVSASERELLECLAIFAFPTTSECVSSVTGSNSLRILSLLEGLTSKGLVSKDSEGFSLSHGLLKRVVTGLISDEKATLYHRAAAHVLERDPDSNTLELSTQYEGCSDHAGAFRTLWIVGERELWACNQHVANDYLQRARFHLDSDETILKEKRALFLLTLARSELFVGNIKSASSLIAELEEDCSDEEMRHKLCQLKAEFHCMKADYRSALTHSLKAIEHASDGLEKGRGYIKVAEISDGLGTIEDAVLYLGKARREFESEDGDYNNIRLAFVKAYEAFLKREYSTAFDSYSQIGPKVHTLYVRPAYYSGRYIECLDACNSYVSSANGSKDDRFCFYSYYAALSELALGRVDCALLRLQSLAPITETHKHGYWCLALLVELFVDRSDEQAVTGMLGGLSGDAPYSGETESVFWRAKAKAYGLLGDDRCARGCYERSLQPSNSRRAGQWAIAAVSYARFDFKGGNLSRARRTLERVTPHLEEMQIPDLSDQINCLKKDIEEAEAVTRDIEFATWVSEPARVKTIEDAIEFLNEETARIAGGYDVCFRFRDSQIADTGISVDRDCSEVRLVSSRGNAEVVINTSKTLGPGSQTKLDLQRICDLSELVLARFSSENQASVLPDSTAEGFHGIVGVSDSIRHLWNEIIVASENEETVLITGETGTGKELVARGIYSESSRNAGPYVSINCAALSEDLLMAELFGHRKGSFTGAHTDRSGVFEAANSGVLFLDEIGEASPRVQSALLRVLQNGTIRRVGENEEIKIDVRIVAATNRDLASDVESGTFRRDLFYRLAVFEIKIPPLRDRQVDIPPLVDHFLAQLSKQTGKEVIGIEKATLDHLVHRKWSGNVRELENWIRVSFLRTNSGRLLAHRHIGKGSEPETTKNVPLKEQVETLEKEIISQEVERVGGNVSMAARRLGMSRAGLQKKMIKYSLGRRA